MRGPWLLVPAVLLTSSAMAQRSALPPGEALDRDLKRNRLGTWLVLEDEGAAWGAALRAALDDDALAELNLPQRVVSGGKKPDALAPILRERYGWSKGAHWALVDAAGRILAEGVGQPMVPGLVSAVAQAGVKSRTQELVDFLRQNPDHLEARSALLRERVLVANRRTLASLGPAKEAASGGEGTPPEPARELDAEKDLKIWSTVARQLDELLSTFQPETAWEVGTSLRVALAEHSPLVKAVLVRHRSSMEEALRRRPNAAEPWTVWLMASRKCGGWPLMPLIQSLQPLPGTGPGEWPPMMVQTEYVKDARARRDWASIRDLLEPRWEWMRSREFGQGFMGNLWGQTLSPLLEALVSLGEVEAADQVVNDAMANVAWSGLPGQARDLATRLNRPDLAARWGALTPKGR
jgi:hypothetical protein